MKGVKEKQTLAEKNTRNDATCEKAPPKRRVHPSAKSWRTMRDRYCEAKLLLLKQKQAKKKKKNRKKEKKKNKEKRATAER